MRIIMKTKIRKTKAIMLQQMEIICELYFVNTDTKRQVQFVTLRDLHR